MHAAKTSAEAIRLAAVGAEVDARDNKERTALMVAAEAGKMDLVRTLLELGANSGNVRQATVEVAELLAWWESK